MTMGHSNRTTVSMKAFLRVMLTSVSLVLATDENTTAAPSANVTNSTNSETGTQPPSDDDGAFPSSTLPLLDVNILVLTDVQGWIGGHERHEPHLNVDFGDILSFHQQLKQQMEIDQDLFLVMNGGFLRGGGVVATNDPPRAMGGIIEDMPFDLVTLGHHEVEQTGTIEFLREPGGLLDWWGPKLVTSNLITNTTQQPFGHYHRYIHGKSTTVLALGFLEDATAHDYTSGLVEVLPISEAIESSQFRALLENKDFNVILVLAYMDAGAVRIILSKIRSICGKDMIVQFIGGRSQRRISLSLDAKASVVQAGASLNTLGFVSIDTAAGSFQHEFLDANNSTFAGALFGDSTRDYMTEKGLELREFIDRVQESSGGNEILGCSPKRYRADGQLDEADSLLRLHLRDVMERGLLQESYLQEPEGHKNALLQRIESFVGYDLFPGVITMNDLAASIPQDDTIRKVAHSLQGDKMNRLQSHLADKSTFLNGTTSTYAFTTDVEHGVAYELFVLSQEAPKMHETLTDMRVRHPVNELVQNGDKTIRGVWIDFIKKEWPYDGESCTAKKPDSEAGEDDNGSLETPATSEKATEVPVDESAAPTGSTVGGAVGLALAMAAILLIIMKVMSKRKISGNSGMRNGVELRSMKPSRRYRDDPASYQGPPSGAFQHNVVV